MFKKIVTLLLCLLLLAPAVSAMADDVVYPIPGNVNLTYFGQLHSKVAKAYTGWDDLQVVKDWFAATGVTLTFQCPPSGMETEQFNLMLASGDYTDIIVYDMMHKVDGGLTQLYEDGVIADLTEYLPEYMPNYWKYLNDHPAVMKEVMNDNGQVLCIPFAKGGGYLLATQGPIVREDILAELGLGLPATIADWDVTLKAVKAAYPDMIPFTGTMDNLMRTFTPAYGIASTYDTTAQQWIATADNVAIYAPIQPAFKEFLTQMNAWYEEGLIDADVVSIDLAGRDNKMTAGLAFSTFGAGSNQVGSYMKANEGGTYSVVGVRQPTINAEDQVQYITEYGATANPQCAISTSCDNLKEAMEMYDWAFSEEGSMRLNWGVEGVSYTLDDAGMPHYTDLILKNPEGLAVDTILAQYALVAVKGPAMLVQDPNYMLEYYGMDQQQRSIKAWVDKNMDSFIFPPVSYTSEENDTFTNTMADINTYVNSMISKFIVGSESLDNFDKFVQTVNNMNLDVATAIQQAALDRFVAR